MCMFSFAQYKALFTPAIYYVIKITIKVCSHLTSPFAFASKSPSKFNIASMVTQTQMHRMGLNQFSMLIIKCEQSISFKDEKNHIRNNVINIRCE